MPDGKTVDDDSAGEPITRFGALPDRVILQIEIVAYVLLGLLLAVAAVLGILNAASLLLVAAKAHKDALALVIAIDRLLFVLMVAEILHTVRASFRSGTPVCEPFLVVGLIASIRRVLGGPLVFGAKNNDMEAPAFKSISCAKVEVSSNHLIQQERRR